MAWDTEHAGSSSRRVSEVVEPEDTLVLELGDEPVEAEIGLVVASQPSGGILKENPSSTFKEFDMLKMRYMYQIPAFIEIPAPLPHKCINWDILGW